MEDTSRYSNDKYLTLLFLTSLWYLALLSSHPFSFGSFSFKQEFIISKSVLRDSSLIVAITQTLFCTISHKENDTSTTDVFKAVTYVEIENKNFLELRIIIKIYAFLVKMRTDKKLFYNFIMILLYNIGVLITMILVYESLTFLTMLLVLVISMASSVFPILISKLRSKIKNTLGYGIPILLLLPIPYLIYDYYTCTEKLCQMFPIILGGGFGLSAFIFALFYFVGVNSEKWGSNQVLVISITLPVVLFFGLWLLVFL